jgi:CheY-like chemotaxis protein
MQADLKVSDIGNHLLFIETLFRPEIENKGMSLAIRRMMSPEEVCILTDSDKLRAILSNLVRNAIKYSAKGIIEVGYEQKGESIEFFVRDQGIGIPKDRQSAIFERFIQADISDKQARQGAGLGLTITKFYVEMLGGKIRVDSEEGRGSVFYFTIPYDPHLRKQPVNGVAPDGNRIPKKKLKILIAEDNELSGMLLSLQVKSFGEEIITVNSGIKAIEACRENPDIDLILMDIQMPVMGGYEAIQQIRQFNREVIIIAQTAYGLVGERRKTLEAGCNDYITKPINVKELKELIHRYFD